MRIIISIICLLLISINLIAQPSNNDCSGQMYLGEVPLCDGQVFSNRNATAFDIQMDNEPNCFTDNPPQNDVWFSFNLAAGVTDITLTIEGIDINGNNPLTNPQLAIYRGFCSANTLSLRECASSVSGETSVSLDVSNLTIGEVYYLRIDNYGGDSNQGDFTICFEEQTNEFNIDQAGSTACSGTLYDSGGPDGNYTDNENNEFTICPTDIHQCIVFDLAYYNIENGQLGFGDVINFYDGADTNAPLIATLQENNSINHGGGGVCFSVSASECLTIQMVTDGNSNFEGFEGSWECFLQPCTELVSLTVEENPEDSEIEDALSTPLSQVQIVSINCADEAYGTFNASDDVNLGINKGILLTTGDAANAVGPNTNGETSDVEFELPPGDDDLDVLSDLFGDGTLSFDACVIEVDVFANTNELFFEYIFGSEEYPEWIGQFNDIFALLISGPGITDGIPQIGGQKNLATLPDDTFVEINNVNHLSNWEYYRNNSQGTGIEYDGLTSDRLGNKKSLTARSEVIPCNTYRLKFAIADRQDAGFDSGVFISEISSGTPMLDISFTNGLDYFVESCLGTNDFISIELDQPLDEDISFDIDIQGTAIQGVDYILNIPSEITFPAGTTLLTYPISIIQDGIMEGTESISIILLKDYGCGIMDVDKISIEIVDELEVNLDIEKDSISVCSGFPLELTASGAVEYIWSPDASILSGQNTNQVMVNTSSPSLIIVEGSLVGNNDPGCIDVDSIHINVIDPSVMIQASTDSICFGDTIFVEAINNIDDLGLQWGPDFSGIDDPNASSTFIIPPFVDFGRMYSVTIGEGDCIATDSIFLYVDAFDIPILTTTDTIVCQGTSFPLAWHPFVSETPQFQWTPGNYLDDPTIPDPIFTAEEDVDYELVLTSANDLCSETFNVSIDVLSAEVDIQNDDPIQLCLGDSAEIVIEVTDGNSTTTETVSITPTESNYFYFSDTLVSGCIASDSIWVQVDSLPGNLNIQAIPNKDLYCFGEVISFLSTGYDSELFPNIMHQWTPATGIDDYASNQDNLNVGVVATESLVYTRVTTSGLCSQTETIEINVVNPSGSLSVMDTIVCPGTSFVAELSSMDELSEISWTVTGPLELSCTDCANPTITVNGNGTASVTAEVMGCPFSTSLNAGVPPGFSTIDIEGIKQITIGTETTLEAIIDPLPVGNISWTINGEPTNESGFIISHTPTEEWTEYIITFMDNAGCIYTYSTFVRALIPEFLFPNAFTPDRNDPRDSSNIDFNYLVGYDVDDDGNISPSELRDDAEYELMTFQIYNRFGETMIDCDTRDCAEEGWDGIYQEKRQPGDMYIYLLQAILPNEQVITKEGSVLLIR